MNDRKSRFDRRMENFTEIRYTANKFLRPVTIVVRAEGERVEIFSRGVSGELCPFFEFGAKSDFLAEFSKLRVGKWKKRYVSRGGLFGGRGWELSIRFADGGNLKYVGDNSYPSTFRALDRLLKADYAI